MATFRKNFEIMEKDRSLYGDRKRDEERVDLSSVDSPVNTSGSNDPHHSKTIDEDAATDPNEVPDKASFDQNANDRTRFDGEIGI